MVFFFHICSTGYLTFLAPSINIKYWCCVDASVPVFNGGWSRIPLGVQVSGLPHTQYAQHWQTNEGKHWENSGPCVELHGPEAQHWDRRVCTSILNPAVLAPHKLSLPFSHLSSSCSHTAKSYERRSSCKTYCGEGQMWVHPCPKPAFCFWSRLHHDVHEVICWEIAIVKHPVPHILPMGNFSPWGAGFALQCLTPQFWHHINYHFLRVTHPPHAVMPLSLTNLGPVARLED